MEIFKLIKLKVKEHDVFKEKIEFDFFQISDAVGTSKPYFTMVLGPNGTGKSNLLRLIIEIFKIAHEKSTHKEVTKYPKGKYLLEYFLNDGYYTILNTLGNSFDKVDVDVENNSSDGKGIRIFKDGVDISFDLAAIPKSILAVSIMLNDKFPVFSNGDFSIYHYLGVKSSPNTAGTRSYITKTIEMVFKAASKKGFIEDTAELLKFLELDLSLYISYYPRYKHIFYKGNMTVELMDDFFNDYTKYLKRETEPWSINNYKNIKEVEPELIPKLVDLLNYISPRLQFEYEGSRTKFYDFDIFDKSTDVLEHLRFLPYLQKLDLLSYPAIVLQKEGRFFSSEDSSSGEYHLISTIIGILACISDNSLILIDEPEISLHPNWQMKYIDLLNQIFKNYPSCHFVVCSHSHFLVSDLRPENSTIISLTKQKIDSTLPSKFNVVAKQLPFNTFGWSAEDILYNIFNVRSSLNYYLEADLTELLGMISNGIKDVHRIEAIILKLDALPRRKNDPLQEIIMEAKEYLNSVK